MRIPRALLLIIVLPLILILDLFWPGRNIWIAQGPTRWELWKEMWMFYVLYQGWHPERRR